MNDDSYIFIEIEKSSTVLNYFYIFIDIFGIFFYLFFLKTNVIIVKRLRYIIKQIFFIDIIIRIIFFIKYTNLNIYKRIIISFVSALQFYLFLYFFKVIYSNILKKNNKLKEIKAIKLSLIFLLFIFPYDKIVFKKLENKILFIISINIIIGVVQSICIMTFMLRLYKIMKTKMKEIINNFIIETQQFKNIYKIMIGFPFPYLIFNMVYHLFKIFFIFFPDSLIQDLGNFSSSIINESSKYFLFFICAIFLDELNKIRREEKKKRIDNNNNLLDDIKFIVQ